MPDLALPRHHASAARASEWLEARLAEASEPVRIRALLASAEAVANALEHGPEGDEGATVRLSFRREPLGFVVSVADGGRGPRQQDIDEASLPESPHATGGRGLYLMRALADEVRVQEGTVCLRFRADR